MFDQNPEEHYIQEGDPGKPTYYIIRRMNEDTDISTMYRLVMGHVRYALSKGWLPVVDMQNYPNPYLSLEKLGKENAWEYFFEQPFQINLEEAYNAENVILSDGDCVKPYPDYSMKLLQKKTDDLTEWRMLVKLGLLKMNPSLKKEVSALRKKIFLPDEIKLGVLLCGSDSNKKIKGQPIPPPAAFAVNTVKEKFREWICDKIILATDDKALVEMFKDNFGDRCISLDQFFPINYDTAQDNPNDNPNDNPADNPNDTPDDTPNDNPADNPNDNPADTPNDNLDDNPADTSNDNPADNPNDNPDDTPNDNLDDNPNESNPADDQVNLNIMQAKKQLLQMILLGGCNSFIADRCSEATVTMLLVKKFGHTLFFNFGNY